MEKNREDTKDKDVNAEIEEKEFCLDRLTVSHTLSYNDKLKTANNILFFLNGMTQLHLVKRIQQLFKKVHRRLKNHDLE